MLNHHPAKAMSVMSYIDNHTAKLNTRRDASGSVRFYPAVIDESHHMIAVWYLIKPMFYNVGKNRKVFFQQGKMKANGSITG